MDIWCEHSGCVSRTASPQYTKAIRELRKHEKQPKYFCTKHRSKHPNVSPTTGRGVKRAA